MSIVKHKQIYKPIFSNSGIANTTLCGRVRNDQDYNVADHDEEVTCKFCLKLLLGKTINFNSKWIDWQPPKEF